MVILVFITKKPMKIDMKWAAFESRFLCCQNMHLHEERLASKHDLQTDFEHCQHLNTTQK